MVSELVSTFVPLILKQKVMAVNSKDIETLWKRYSDEAVHKGISVAQYFESNGVPYHTFEQWYKKKFSQSGIVACVVSSESDGSLPVSGGSKFSPSNTDKQIVK